MFGSTIYLHHDITLLGESHACGKTVVNYIVRACTTSLFEKADKNDCSALLCGMFLKR